MNQDYENQLTNALTALIQEEIENFEFTDLEVEADYVIGLDNAITSYLENHSDDIEIPAKNVGGLDDEIRDEIASIRKDGGFSVEADDVDGFDEAVLNALQHHDDIHGWVKDRVKDDIDTGIIQRLPWLLQLMDNAIADAVEKRIQERHDRFFSYLSPVAWWKWFVDKII
jgi:hypothetical protein